MFHWEPEGRYRHGLCTAITPFWLSTDDISLCTFQYNVNTYSMPGRKTDNVNAFLSSKQKDVEDKTPKIKNPISIVNKMARYDIWRQNLASYEILTNKTYQRLAKQSVSWVPGKTMHVFMSFFRAPDDVLYMISWTNKDKCEYELYRCSCI